MRVAVLSDIHANIEAFRAVLHDLENRADRTLNLGDLVGYNASPNACVDLARDLGMHSIQGNHDQAVCHPELAQGFNIFAQKAIIWTRSELTEDNIRYLSGLKENCRIDNAVAFHGSPESTFSYIGLHFQAKATLRMMKKGKLGMANVCLFGHTHIRKVWQMDIRGKVAPLEIPSDGIVRLHDDEFYLLNPGSVGQPRNGDNHSSYLIMNSEEKTVEFRQVEYDIPETMKKIMAAGLPDFFASRLLDGI